MAVWQPCVLFAQGSMGCTFKDVPVTAHLWCVQTNRLKHVREEVCLHSFELTGIEHVHAEAVRLCSLCRLTLVDDLELCRESTENGELWFPWDSSSTAAQAKEGYHKKADNTVTL